MKNTKIVGDKTEARVFSALVEMFPAVMIPFGENSRYDFVIEDHDGTLKKIQCKTGRYKNGSIVFNTCSSHKGVRTSYTSEEIDFFAVACPDFIEVFLVPIADVTGTTEMALRVDEVK